MHHLCRWLSPILVLASLAIVAMASPATAGPTPADGNGRPASGPVVVVGVPDLRWQDVDPGGTPTLWRLAGRSSIAAMTDRAGERITSRTAGWLTVNTGSRARAGVNPTVASGPAAVPDPADPAQLQALRLLNRSARYRSQVGALGDALHHAGRTVAAAGGPGALLGAMTGGGSVDSTAPTVAAALRGRADVVVIEFPQLYGVDRGQQTAVHDALAAIDDGVGAVLEDLPDKGSLLVAGVSDGAVEPAHLHVAMATGPLFGAGRLTSASTGRTAVVQLMDLGPTVLSLTGVPVPSSMIGTPWLAVADPGGSTARAVSALVDLDRRSVTALAALRWYDAAVAWTALLFVAATLFAWTRGRTRLPRSVGAVVASVPIASYLVQLAPWWLHGSWLLAPLTVAGAGALGLTAAHVPWSRRDPWRTAAVVGAVTAAVLVADAATGSPLSLDAPFGDNPIIAGRFHGLGNVAFALMGTGTLVLAAALAARLPPRRAAAVVFGLGAAAIVVDGHPSLGDDFGGVLALVPAVAILALVVSRVRIAVSHVLAVLVTTATVTVLFALYDYSRPASQRTHLGRFIGQVADGASGPVLHRKLDSTLSTFTSGWGRWIVVGWVVLALVAYLGHRRGWLRLPAAVDRRTAGGLLAALLVLAFVGAALNDSGLQITAFTFYLAAPLLVPLLEPIPGPATAPPSPSRAAGPAAVSS